MPLERILKDTIRIPTLFKDVEQRSYNGLGNIRMNFQRSDA
jgi:hypothetical protein